MKIIIASIVFNLIAINLAFPASAYAETTTLNQVIRDSLSKNTSMFKVQKDYQDKLANATEAQILDNPELSVKGVQKKGTSGTGTDIELTQPLKLSQLTGSRMRYAEALTKAADIEQKFEILKVINETSVVYTQVYLLTMRKKLYENYANDAAKMKILVSGSAKQGQTSPAAAHLFSADAAKLQADATAVDASLRQARSELSRLTGKSYVKANLQRPPFSAIPANLDTLQKFANSRANLRSLIKNRISVAQRKLNVAEQDAALPEIAPRLMYSRSPNGDEKSYGAGIALRIPLWNQNDAERKRASAELWQAESEADLYANLPQKDIIRELRQSAAAMQKRSESYFKTILPSYRKSYELTRTMFREGQAGALEVWQVREKLLASENEALESVAQAMNARGQLELELGGKLEEIQ